MIDVVQEEESFRFLNWSSCLGRERAAAIFPAFAFLHHFYTKRVKRDMLLLDSGSHKRHDRMIDVNGFPVFNRSSCSTDEKKGETIMRNYHLLPSQSAGR